jgi:scyllo-inositol 2-dehydrogenase (NADP+)
MRVVIVGLGVQGEKRARVAGDDANGTVDPINMAADYRRLEDAPINSYDAALLCVPDEAKMELINFLLQNGKHCLVEKPLIADDDDLERIARMAKESGVVCYTAYNHRFEPHFIRMKNVLESGELGKVYSLRMFYGNGTARLVRESAWRDQGTGVLPDLGSHLLDTLSFWVREVEARKFTIVTANCFENKTFDHINFGSSGIPDLQLEMTLMSWRNHFYADVTAEHGSAHITSLCKWGPTEFVLRDRKLPSGRPNERITRLVQSDPTWDAEYTYFKAICSDPRAHNFGNTQTDIWINSTLRQLGTEALQQARRRAP